MMHAQNGPRKKRKVWMKIGIVGCVVLFLLAAVIYLYEKKDNHDRIRVTAIFGSETISFWEEVREGLREKAKERKIVLTEYSPEDESLFPLLIESAGYTDVDAVAICIYETDMWEECQPILAKMREKGIKIIVADTPPKIDDYDVYIGLDNYAIGQEMAENIYQNYEEGQRILMYYPDEGNLVLGQRASGCRDRLIELGLEEMIDYISIFEDEIERITTLKEYLHNMERSAVVVVFTTNASVSAAEIIDSEGVSGQVRLVGFGESREVENYVENGMLDVFFQQDNKGIGSKVIEAAEALCGGQVLKDEEWNVDVLVYPKEQ